MFNYDVNDQKKIIEASCAPQPWQLAGLW